MFIVYGNLEETKQTLNATTWSYLSTILYQIEHNCVLKMHLEVNSMYNAWQKKRTEMTAKKGTAKKGKNLNQKIE